MVSQEALCMWLGLEQEPLAGKKMAGLCIYICPVVLSNAGQEKA